MWDDGENMVCRACLTCVSGFMQAPLFSGLPAPTRRRKLPKASFGVPIDFGELTEDILEESKVTRALTAWVPAGGLCSPGCPLEIWTHLPLHRTRAEGDSRRQEGE